MLISVFIVGIGIITIITRQRMSKKAKFCHKIFSFSYLVRIIEN